MIWLRKPRYRMVLSALLTAFLVMGAGNLSGQTEEKALPGPALAWWGTIYPEFCFTESRQEKNHGEQKIRTRFFIGELLLEIWEHW